MIDRLLGKHTLTALVQAPGWSVLAGLAQALSLAAPWSGQPIWWLQCLSLALLTLQLPHAIPWTAAAWRGWLFATAWLAGTLWWLFISMHRYGDIPAPLAVAAVLALAGFMALFYAAACGAFAVLAPTGKVARASLFAALWLLAELARGRWLTGLPWGMGGYAQVQGPLASLAPWVGVYGITALVAWAAYALAQGGFKAAGWPWAAVLGLAALAPAPTGQSTGALSVTVLQGNIPQDEKFSEGTGIPVALAWYQQQLDASRASLTVAPETAIPLLPSQLPTSYWDALQQRFTTGTQAALIGIPLGSMKEGYSNSVIGLRPGAAMYRYDKHHLVPFGEFIPPLFRWFTDLMQIPLGDFNRGALGQPSFAWQGQRLAPNICYEDLFGEELAQRFRNVDTAPTIFVNVSNMGWFGGSSAIDQHVQISRMRTLEFDRPMVRATNTGATVILDHQGHTVAALPRLTRAVLTGAVEGRSGLTPYAYWIAHWGLWPLWGLGLLGLLMAAVSRLRRAP